MLSIAVARCRPINGSIELIVQAATKDAVGEMGVRGDLPTDQTAGRWCSNESDTRGRSDACGVKVAKVHVEALYFPSPTGNCQYPLRAVAHHPAGINLRMTEGLGKRELTGDAGANRK